MSLIDKLGRKTLLLIGAAGTASCLAAVSWLFATNSHPGALVWVLITYIAFFALSQGAVIWVYIGEVFPNAVRSKGQGVGNASHWIMNTLIALEFPVLQAHIGRSAPFTFFAIMTAIQFRGGAVYLSGDQGADAGSLAAQADARRVRFSGVTGAWSSVRRLIPDPSYWGFPGPRFI